MRRWIVVFAALLLSLPAFGGASVGAESAIFMRDEFEWDYPPGPGWPAGWVAPARPAELSEVDRASFERFKRGPGGAQLSHMELFVSPVTPPWTSEYAWKWMREVFPCGSVVYVYHYQVPDVSIINEQTGLLWYYHHPMSPPEGCEVTPITRLYFHEDDSELQKQFLAREWEYFLDHAWSQLAPEGTVDRPLPLCYPHNARGTIDEIVVCMNFLHVGAGFDSPAYLDASIGRVRVPLRFVSEAMRASVEWDASSQTITITFPEITRTVTYIAPPPGEDYTAILHPETKNFRYALHPDSFADRVVHQPSRTIILTIGDSTAYVDGQPVYLDAPPVIVPPGRTMVPVRFISEVMGSKVYWVGQDSVWKHSPAGGDGIYQVHIFTPFYPAYEYPNYFLVTYAQGF